jgi:hypothetical protein
MLSNLLGLLWV